MKLDGFLLVVQQSEAHRFGKDGIRGGGRRVGGFVEHLEFEVEVQGGEQEGVVGLGTAADG